MRRTIAFASLILLCCAKMSIAFEFKRMDVDITIHKDSIFKVIEDIRVDFLGESRHGIFRDIRSVTPDRSGSQRSLRINVLSVTNGQGNRWEYVGFKKGANFRIKIGSADRVITGPQRFVIVYVVQNGLGYFPDHDELWWNVTGSEWESPIEAATCTVHTPQGVLSDRIQAAGWIGAYGSTESCKLNKTRDSAVYWTPRALNYGEGLTIAIGWPKGFVTPPSATTRILWFVTDNYFAGLPLIFLLGLIYTWRAFGRDPDIGVSETVRYEPPNKLRPAELGTLLDERVDLTDITSTIIDLAVRGYLQIQEIPATGFFSRKSYNLIKVIDRTRPDPHGGLADYETAIYKKVFELGDTVEIDDLKNHFYTAIPDVKRKLYNSLVHHQYFRSRPDSVRGSWMTAGIVLLVGGAILAIVMLGRMDSGKALIAPGWGFSLAICGVLTVLFSRAMPRKTAGGRRAFLDTKGFEEYLRRAEIEHIALAERKHIFESFLPYAICLGVADGWSRAFEGIYTEPPDWYTGGVYDGGFRPYYFTNSLNGAMRNLGSAMVSAPRSASQGGSAFGGGSGGGGFSGGGFGGGGGGSW